MKAIYFLLISITLVAHESQAQQGTPNISFETQLSKAALSIINSRVI